MMMNRERMSFWIRLVAILLAVFFVGSFVFMGLGTNISYNLFDLFGNSGQQQASQTTGTQEQIELAEEELEENPNNPEAIKDLAALYYQVGRYDDAVRVLQEGRQAAPKDADIPMLLGQIYSQQAQATPEEGEKKELYAKAGDAYAAATEIEPQNEDAYLLAGQAYDEADEPAQAIKYWNGYLRLEPEGEQSEAIEERISALLKGEQTTGGAQP